MPTVLVVEDEPDIRLMTRLMLEDPGYEVLEATTGQEALSMLMKENPDLVLLDIRLPDIEGWEVLRTLRSDPRLSNLPVLIMSAHSSGDFRERAAEEGSDGYLVKPFSRIDLLQQVKELLKRRSK